MTVSTNPKNIPTPPALKAPISIHRAFIYSAGAPGWGDIYAGARLRGYATLFLFIFFAAGLTWRLTQALITAVGHIFDNLNGIAPSVMPPLPIASIGITFFGIYFTWLWAMLSAVDTATAQRQKDGCAAQISVGWALALSWFCPGSGQIYTAERRLGFILFGAYLLGILLLMPAYQQLYQSLSDLATTGQLPANNPYAIIGIVHELVVRVNYSFGKILQESIKYYALAATMAALKQGPLHADTKWLHPSAAYIAALLGIGWLCPGAGQLLQGRYRFGWGFFAGYFSSQFLIGLLLGESLITVETADTLVWLPVIVQWAAMIEAPFAMRRARPRPNRGLS
jgi:hypothetical protein